MELNLHDNLENTFYQLVNQSVERRGIDVSDEVRVYLVNVLAQAGNLLQEFDGSITFEFLKKKDEVKLQHIGDYCLYLAGYFPDFLKKNGQGQVDYHIALGSSAYSSISSRRRPHFTELAENFSQLRFVLGDISPIDENIDTPEELLRIYEKWQETKDPRYFSLLVSQGLIPQIKNIQA